MQRVLVQVPLSQPFVCPECAAPLRAPIGSRIGKPRNLLPALRIGVLCIAMLIAACMGYGVGRVQDRAAAAAAAAAHGAKADLVTAGQSFGLTDTPPTAPAAGAPPPIFVAERPYPSHAASVDVTRPPAHLAHEQRFGQVTLDCLMTAPESHAACKLTDIRGADAFSAQALVWLQSLAVRYAPSLRNGISAPLDHRWRVVLDDYSGVAPPASGAR